MGERARASLECPSLRVYFQSQHQKGNIIYTTENTVSKEDAPGAKKTTIKSWKERSRRP